MNQEKELERIPMTGKVDETTTLMAPRREEQHCSCELYQTNENYNKRDLGVGFIWMLFLIAAALVVASVMSFVLS